MRARKMTKKIIKLIGVEADEDTSEEQILEMLNTAINETQLDLDYCEVITSEESEICNECGISVAWGSGWYVNRVPDFNSIIQRIRMGKGYPLGDYVCARCDNYANSHIIDSEDDVVDEAEEGDKNWWVDFGSYPLTADTKEEAIDKAEWLRRKGDYDPEMTIVEGNNDG